MTGHIADRCYKLHGYPPSHKPRSAVAHQISAFDANVKDEIVKDVCHKGEFTAKTMENFVETLSSEQY